MATKKRMIDANALPYENQVLSYDDEWCLKVSEIESAPTVDAVEVVHGRWEQGDYYDYGDVCSVCDWDSEREPCKWSYCPNCGAKMDGVGNGKPER